VKQALGDKVEDVRVTLRLTDSPACLVVAREAMSPHLARLLKAAGQKAPDTRPILELNPRHPLVARLRSDDAQLAEWAQVLLDEAQLAEGGALEDPAAFVRRVNALLQGAAASDQGASTSGEASAS
jgi:molecular chaperone HtpG